MSLNNLGNVDGLELSMYLSLEQLTSTALIRMISILEYSLKQS